MSHAIPSDGMFSPEPFQPRHQQLLEAFFERHRATLPWSFGECAGFLFAVQSAPEMVPPSAWLPVVLNEREFADESEAEPVLGGLLALLNWIGERIERDELPIPSGYRPRSPTMDNYGQDNPFSQWGHGLVIGHEWLRKLWAQHVPDHEELMSSVMAPVMFLADIDHAREMHRQAFDQERSFEEVAEHMLADLPRALIEYAEAGHRAFQAGMQQHTQPARSDKVGRNDPCPCGSGKKYKKCCLPRERQARERRPDPAHAGPDFQGLSPNQMHQLIYSPFESPELVHFRDCLATEPQAPILGLVGRIIDGIGDRGLKATAKGNLPRQFCIDALAEHENYTRPYQFAEFTRLRGEADYPDLHHARLVAELAGLIEVHKGRFRVTDSCRESMASSGYREVYPQLLRTFAREFNWAYPDRYADMPIVQKSFAYSLYLLQRHATAWRKPDFYAESFIRAFPAALDYLDDDALETAAEHLKRLYSHRALTQFAHFFGLIEIERDRDDYLDRNTRLRSLPLLEEVVRFTPDGPGTRSLH